jgi:hypothetical protein
LSGSIFSLSKQLDHWLINKSHVVKMDLSRGIYFTANTRLFLM